MNAEEHSRIELSTFQSDGSLRGFVVSGRWPATTREWAQVLAMTVRIASLPGLLPTSTVFGVKEELPENPEPGTVGLVVAEGPVLGERAVRPGRFAEHQPPALIMLHPPSETTPSLPENAGAASGCVLLPGIPHLGLEHRAAWVEAEPDGTVTALVSKVGVDPGNDPDTAILAMLLAS
ncbi:peptidase [Rhodococcus gordoniae]|uniref:peptidase n=1 Tax=Rhodococcus gordoniae TaxID=223392 RepID=UPI0020CE6834|nr:peptidase [Rhodococcus gordoniae]UTT48766.1 peptidase [Rhodococcus gordoniae]